MTWTQPSNPAFRGLLRRSARWLVPLGLLAALLLARIRVVVGGEGGEDELQEPAIPELVAAGDLWSHPGRYLGRELRFRVRFKDWVADWNPFLTRFGPAEYRAFTGWGEYEFPWEERAFEEPCARVFLRRGDASEWALEDAALYDSFELVGRVKAVFGAEPWIEVTGAVPVLITISEGTVLHAARAVDLMADENWQRAEDELGRALAAPMPESARAELRRLERVCDEAAQAATEAMERVRQDARELSGK